MSQRKSKVQGPKSKVITRRRPWTLDLGLWTLLCAPVFGAPVAPAAAQQYRQGLAYERLGRYNEAYTQLQVAANLDSANAEVALALGVVANRLGYFDEAQRALERSIVLDANSVASYYLLALIYEKKGLADRALETWHRFVKLTQDEPLKTLAQKHIAYLQSRTETP
jgi:tetratricopeptide (TPR) repeat protein